MKKSDWNLPGLSTNFFLPYFGILNSWIAQINELKTYLEKLLKIDTLAS